jgi:hypothetical protein
LAASDAKRGRSVTAYEPVDFATSTMTERQWLGVVLATASRSGWETYHTHDSRRSQPGFPDLVLIRPPEMITAELKTNRGQLTANQSLWLALLAACAIEIHVWRPRDFDLVCRRLLQAPVRRA